MKFRTKLLLTCLTLVATISLIAYASEQRVQKAYTFTPEQKLRLAERIVETYYVDTTDINKTVEAGIIGMLQTLDPHSTYTNPEETKEMTEPLEGEFSGIGIQFNMLNDTLYVVNPIVGGPSEKVGILAGDRIISANDTILSGANKTTTDIRRSLRGAKGTTVDLKIQRQSEPGLLDFTVTRADIPIYSVDASYMATPSTGYIRITRFAEGTAEEVAKALLKLKKEGMTSVILDLQSNGGGFMAAATQIMNMFLDEGATIVYTKGLRTPPAFFKADGSGRYRDVKVVVLVDQHSASASEIVAGAFQDNDRGVIVGRRTFGKGLVQRPFPFPDGSMIRLTTARYYTPSGRSIQKPYTKGEKEYRKEILERLKSGELTSDSVTISHPDSLKYSTKAGRLVYGGGGITPDVMVAMDTTYFTDYHRDLTAKGLLTNAALKYIDSHRQALTAAFPTEKSFIETFNVSADLLSRLNAMADKEGLKPTLKDELNTNPRIKTYLKAIIGRNLYGDNTFYKIVNPLNPTYKKALELLRNDKRYEAILKNSPNL